MSAPPVGALVRWVNGATSSDIGVITGVANAGKRVQIHFDHEGQRLFAWPNDVVERAVFPENSYVQVHGTDQIGVVESVTPIDSILWYSIQLPGGELTMVSEASIRPAVVTDPLALLEAGTFHSARSTNLRVVANQLRYAQESGELSALSNSRVEVKPHQVWVTHRVTSTFPHRFLLADEVGLGKTIEAGLIIKELKARNVAERILVLAPSGIVSQWQFELKNKFNETFSRYNRETLAYLKGKHPGENLWTVHDQVIVSDAFASWDERRRAEICQAHWDLVIIDEAHHARRGRQGSSSTNLYKLAEGLAQGDPSRGFLLLTATPLQLHRSELHSLIELLDPALFPSFEDFDAHCSSLSGLNRTVERVHEWEELSEFEKDVALGMLSAWLDRDEANLREAVRTSEGRARLVDDLVDEHKLSEIMVRNRKSVVGGFMPRVAAVWPVELTREELIAYNAVTDYCRTGYRVASLANNQAMGFVMATFQKLNSSSSHAVKQSLKRRIEKLDAKALPKKATLAALDVAEVEVEEKGTEALDPWLGWSSEDRDEEVAELREVVRLLDQIQVDSKTQVLHQGLAQLAADDEHVKVVLFTQSLDTLNFLAHQVRAPWTVHTFHGSMSPQEKDATVAAFREGRGPHILMSTEAGGEGRNFQFCHIIINYDLPWNPMKIEQRIGRVDRIGQKHPVKVINFSLRGTIEERVLEVLDQRIKIFEETIGGLDPILGEVEPELKKLFLLADEEAHRRLTTYATKLEKRVADARAAEERLADFIMDTRSFRQDETRALLEHAEDIGHELVRRFVINSLAELGCSIREEAPDSSIYSIKYQDQFLIDFADLAKEGVVVRGTFDPSVAQEHEDIEFFAMGHVLVDKLVDRALSRAYSGRTSYRVIRTDNHDPMEGWFFTYALELDGVTSRKEVLPVFVTRDGYSREESEWLLARTGRLKNEDSSGPSSKPDLAFGRSAAAQAKAVAIKELIERQARLAAANGERAEKERTKIIRFFDYRKNVGDQKVGHARDVVKRLEETGDPESLKILPVWKKNLDNAEKVLKNLDTEQAKQLAQLAQREQVKAKQQLLTASLVQVVPRNLD